MFNPDHDFLETESDKINLFCESLAVPKDVLPARVYEGALGSHPTVRYFVDKFPLFLAAPLSGALPVVTFGFVDSGTGSLWSFVAHLAAYQGLFRHLKSFRLLYIAPRSTEFRRAEERFRSSVKQPLESDVSGEILRYFVIRRKWEKHEYVVPVTADFEFLNDARRRFHGVRFENLYQAWFAGRISERELRLTKYKWTRCGHHPSRDKPDNSNCAQDGSPTVDFHSEPFMNLGRFLPTAT